MYKFCPHCGKAFIEVAEPRSVPVVSQKKDFLTWEKVLELSNNDEASKFFEVGDEVYETLKSGEEIVLVVVGKDMYREGDVIFGLKDCLKDEYTMNETSTNAGGWKASSMRRYLREQVLPLLPDDLRACIKPRCIDGEYDDLWLFSEMEIFGEHEWTEHDPDCGKQMPYFMRPGNRVKGLGKDGSANFWWERSPSASYSTGFCIVNSNGGAYTHGASLSRGVAFGFCI